MKAVWSFWTKPYYAGRRSAWYSELHHWLAWGLSVYAARRYYPETCLVTDDEGARILVDGLQLPFEHVSTALNELRDEDAGWWCLGKIEAYRLQQQPFVHLDADVFFWEPLSPELEEADVFTQNPVPIFPGASLYRPDEFEQAIGYPGAGWLPKEWLWYRRRAHQHSECCGVFGGTRIDFINDYAGAVLRLVTDEANRAALDVMPAKAEHMFLIEEYMLTCWVEYHQKQKRSPYHGIEIKHLFPTLEDAYKPEYAAAAGFTHLAGSSKRDARTSRHLEQRVRQDLPNYYQRCTSYSLSHANSHSV
jgi:hypothetical protein